MKQSFPFPGKYVGASQRVVPAAARKAFPQSLPQRRAGAAEPAHARRRHPHKSEGKRYLSCLERLASPPERSISGGWAQRRARRKARLAPCQHALVSHLGPPTIQCRPGYRQWTSGSDSIRFCFWAVQPGSILRAFCCSPVQPGSVSGYFCSAGSTRCTSDSGAGGAPDRKIRLACTSVLFTATNLGNPADFFHKNAIFV